MHINIKIDAFFDAVADGIVGKGTKQMRKSGSDSFLL